MDPKHSIDIYSISSSNGDQSSPTDLSDLRAPNIEMRAPGIDMRAPGMEMRPGMDMRAPGMDMRAPGIDMRAPSMELRPPGMDMRAPGLEMRAPGIERKNSSNLFSVDYPGFSVDYEQKKLLANKGMLSMMKVFKNLKQKNRERSGRVPDSGIRVYGFEPHQHPCVVSLSKTHLPLLSTGSTQEDPS